MCACLGAQKTEQKPKGPHFIAFPESPLNCSSVVIELDLAKLLQFPVRLWAFWPSQDNIHLPFSLLAPCYTGCQSPSCLIEVSTTPDLTSTHTLR